MLRRPRRGRFLLEIGREPSHAELASSLGISNDRLRVVLSATLDPLSLDSELKGASRGGGSAESRDARTLADTIPDAQPNPEQEVELRFMRQTLARSLHPHLTAHEHAVVCACYNLIEDRQAPLTYAQIARRFGRTAEWVEKVERRALKKLKGRPMLRNLLATRDLSVDGY